MQLNEALRAGVNGSDQSLDAVYDRATEDTIRHITTSGPTASRAKDALERKTQKLQQQRQVLRSGN